MRGLRAAALLLAAASCAAQNIYDACNWNDAHGTVEKARLLRHAAQPCLAACARAAASAARHGACLHCWRVESSGPSFPPAARRLGAFNPKRSFDALWRSAAQANGGVPIGLAFWINGKLEDWDPVTITASNTTVTSDGAYENITTTRSLHPCNDAAELAAIATPSGIISTTPKNATEPAPSVRGANAQV